jgi:hypothetical protein
MLQKFHLHRCCLGYPRKHLHGGNYICCFISFDSDWKAQQGIAGKGFKVIISAKGPQIEFEDTASLKFTNILVL